MVNPVQNTFSVDGHTFLDEILLPLVSYLDVFALGTCCQVDKLFHRAANNPILWQQLDPEDKIPFAMRTRCMPCEEGLEKAFGNRIDKFFATIPTHRTVGKVEFIFAHYPQVKISYYFAYGYKDFEETINPNKHEWHQPMLDEIQGEQWMICTEHAEIKNQVFDEASSGGELSIQDAFGKRFMPNAWAAWHTEGLRRTWIFPNIAWESVRKRVAELDTPETFLSHAQATFGALSQKCETTFNEIITHLPPRIEAKLNTLFSAASTHIQTSLNDFQAFIDKVNQQ